MWKLWRSWTHTLNNTQRVWPQWASSTLEMENKKNKKKSFQSSRFNYDPGARRCSISSVWAPLCLHEHPSSLLSAFDLPLPVHPENFLPLIVCSSEVSQLAEVRGSLPPRPHLSFKPIFFLLLFLLFVHQNITCWNFKEECNYTAAPRTQIKLPQRHFPALCVCSSALSVSSSSQSAAPTLSDIFICHFGSHQGQGCDCSHHGGGSNLLN